MTYSTTKPDRGPSPLIDVVQIQTNFAQFAAIFSSVSAGIFYNHTPINNKNQGDHESIIFSLQAADPGVTQNKDVLYSKNAASLSGSQPQLFVQIPKFLPNEKDQTDAQNIPMQLTYNAVNTAGPQYQSFLAGGYLVYFGSTMNIAVNIVLSPAPTKILVAIATPNNMTTVGTPIPYTVSTTIINNSTFKINSTLNGSGPVVPYSFGWVAIGSV